MKRREKTLFDGTERRRNRTKSAQVKRERLFEAEQVAVQAHRSVAVAAAGR